MTKARCSQQSITIISLIWANMITHNGKQVTLAMRNRKAINLIARNGKVMFGELEAISFAAKAVILAEYGKQVWSDVKQYAKAHPQIVEFINQDPHLSAYIAGIVPTPERYIYIEQTSASPRNGIDTLLNWSQVGKIEMGFMAGSSLNRIINTFPLDEARIRENPIIATTNFSGWKANTWIDGVAQVSSTENVQMHIFGWNDTGATNTTSCKYIRIYATDDTTLLRNFVPCTTPSGEVVYLDLIECRTHGNDRGTTPFQMKEL